MPLHWCWPHTLTRSVTLIAQLNLFAFGFGFVCQQTNTKGQSVGLAPDVARGCKLNENTAPGNLVTGKWYDTLALPGKSVLSALHATFSSQVLGI